MSVQTPGQGRPDVPDELTIDQLAARVGFTVRNLRAYTSRGLLPPPRLVGRTGYYGPEHVARLMLVREMLDEGWSLAMVERTLSSAPHSASRAALALHRALLTPFLPPEPEVVSVAELAERAGQANDPDLVDRLVTLGVAEKLPDGRLSITDPALLTAGLQVVELGVPPRALIDAQLRVIELVGEIAQTYVAMFRSNGWEALSAATEQEMDAVRGTAARLQAASAQALLASFRTEMARAVEQAVQDELSDDGRV